MSERLKSLLERFRVSDEAFQRRLGELENAKDAAGNPRALTPEEQKEVDDAQAHLERLAVSVKAEKSAEDRRTEMTALEAWGAQPGARDTTGTIARVVQQTVRASIPLQLTATQKFSVFLKAAVSRYYDPSMDIFGHAKEAGFEQLANEWGDSLRSENKTLSSLSNGAGGYAIPTVLSTEFINWLYPQSIFLAGNPVPVDLSAGNLNITGGNASATASYRTENAVISEADASFRQITLSAKNLAALTAITNELLRRSPMAIDTFVQGDLRRAFLLQMDLSLQRGDGSSNTPTGIRNLGTSGQRIIAVDNIAPSAEDIDDELRRLLTLVFNSNMPMERLTWQMAPRTFLYIQNLRTSLGVKAFPEMDGTMPTLKGYPVIKSTQIPINLGSGTNESEISLTDFGHVLFGDTQTMTMDVSREATYDVSGTLKSAFTQNQTVIRLVGSHDVNIRYNAAVGTLTTLKWGA